DGAGPPEISRPDPDPGQPVRSGKSDRGLHEPAPAQRAHGPDLSELRRGHDGARPLADHAHADLERLPGAAAHDEHRQHEDTMNTLSARTTSRRGITLLELMIGVMVLLMLVGSLMQSLRSMSRGASYANIDGELQGQAEHAMRAIIASLKPSGFA